MKIQLAISALGGLLLTGCAHFGGAADDNPFYEPSRLPYHYPPFDRIRDEHFLPAMERGMAESLAEVEAIANNPEPPTFENTLVALDRQGELLSRVSSVFYNLGSARSSDALRAARTEISPRRAAYADQILHNPKLFARIRDLHERRETLGLDTESLRLLEQRYKDFVLAGALLSEKDQAKLRAYNEERASLTTQFRQNLQADMAANALVVKTRDELDGLDERAILAAEHEAESRGLEGKYVLTLQSPTTPSALSQLHNRKVRERLFRASMDRGRRGDKHDNRKVLARIVRLQAERAALLGFRNYAALSLQKTTAGTPEAVNAMLTKLAPAAVENAREEADALQDQIEATGGTFQLKPWDWAYYAEQVRKARYDFDEAQMRPYLALDRVLHDGAFFMARRLYGLSFKPRTDLPVYHPDVRVFEVFNDDGSALGLFLFDPFARPDKRGGAWMNSYVNQGRLTGKRPVVAIHLNIARPVDGPALLTFDQVDTLFHEFGHALHGLFSDVTYSYFSGTSVPRDFVEYPSQVHEMWTTWPEVLKNYARHHETGEVMPEELVGKVLAARRFNQGFATSEYLQAALLDQAWHQLSPRKARVRDVEVFENSALLRAGVKMRQVLPRYRSAYFAHIFSGQYAAGYYSYIWSEVLDADTVQWFREQGGLQRINGEWFRAKVLSKGGSVDAMELYRTFRGRDPQIEPLLERRGLD